MRKAEAQGINAAQMVTAVAVGGLLALGVELLMLLAGSAAVSNGIHLAHLVPGDLLHQQELRGHSIGGQDTSAETSTA